jgi:hypothetical protein
MWWKHKLRSSSVSFLQPPVTFSLLGSNIFSTLPSHNLNVRVYSFLSVTDQVSHHTKERVKL